MIAAIKGNILSDVHWSYILMNGRNAGQSWAAEGFGISKKNKKQLLDLLLEIREIENMLNNVSKVVQQESFGQGQP